MNVLFVEVDIMSDLSEQYYINPSIDKIVLFALTFKD